ncbi:MAG: indole-3-glycerol phosphate synthase TrpC [Muribaculaceae bacterium]|nr:indole-3-glycerol phosphate synthase TrpC [Muribaculaceae bacterium]
MNILKTIAEAKRAEVNAMKALVAERELEERAGQAERRNNSIKDSILSTPGGIIAEFKRRSPSKGEILPMANPEIVGEYARAGAAASSVLTDTRFFGGSLADLAIARKVAPQLPLLRKDFTVDPYQIYQARIAGADAILLIAAILSAHEIAEFTEIAHRFSLEVLLELHDPSEINKISFDVDLIGVNNRDLRNFATNLEASVNLASQLPPEAVKIAESGITSPDDIVRLRQAGFNGFLIGEAFMSTPNPAQTLKQFINDSI